MPPGNAEAIAPGTRIALVRHAESVGNAERIMTGHRSCTGLTSLGAKQAEALAARLERTGELAGAAVLYSSILPRARQTAALISAALGDPPRQETCDLCEMHPGDADGLSWDEYERDYGLFSPRSEPTRALSPGGESWLQVLDRVEAVLHRLALAHPARLVVAVTHGGVIDASMVRILGLPANGTGVRLRNYNTSLTEWQHTGARWALIRYNDIGHITDEIWSDGPRFVLEGRPS